MACAERAGRPGRGRRRSHGLFADFRAHKPRLDVAKDVPPANRKIAAGDGMAAFYDAKLKTARFFAQRMLPETAFRCRVLTAGSETMMEMTAEQF